MDTKLDDLRSDHRLRKKLDEPESRELMELRCEEQGHDYENCITIMLQVYRKCKWCGMVRP